MRIGEVEISIRCKIGIDCNPYESSIPIGIDIREGDQGITQQCSIFDHSDSSSLLSYEYPPIRSKCHSCRND